MRRREVQERKDYTEEELRAYLLKAEEEQEDYMVQLSIARKGRGRG